MKLVIDISEYNAEYIKNAYSIPQDINMVIAEAIINGKQIPTPHGRLGDLDKLEKELRIASKDPYLKWEEARIYGKAISDVRAARTIIKAEGDK